MLANAVATSLLQHSIQPLPSISQFISGVLFKCVVLGLPCVVEPSLHSPLVVNPSDTSNLVTLRGGGGFRGVGSQVDIERAGFRLSGIELYCLASSILLGALTDMYSEVELKDDCPGQMERILRALYSISVATSFSAALYSTIIFSMLGLYGHSALGMGNDAGYSEFVKATSFIRVSGFRSFLLCLVTFKTSFMCNILLNFKGKTRWVVAGVSMVGFVLGLYHVSFIIRTASSLIYSR